MREVFLHAGVRTPIGSFGGALRDVAALTLGTSVGREVLARADWDPINIDEVLVGQVFPAGCGPNLARQIALGVGLDVKTPAVGIQQLCASGMRAVALGAQAIRAGEANAVMAVGVESMSGVPYLLPQARWGTSALGATQLLDPLLSDGLTCPFTHQSPGQLAEALAARFVISRDAQDAYAMNNHQKAVHAQATHRFASELMPLEGRRGRQRVQVTQDEGPRKDTSMESLRRLEPAFIPQGTVTAGNSCGLSDGAAALLLSAQPAQTRLVASVCIGLEPAWMGLGSAAATQRVLEKAGLPIGAIDRFELHDPFAAQALAVLQRLPELDPTKVNVWGGALALGHPVGATGARVLVTLMHTLQAERLRYGLAALCVGGGMGIAMILEHQP